MTRNVNETEADGTGTTTSMTEATTPPMAVGSAAETDADESSVAADAGEKRAVRDGGASATDAQSQDSATEATRERTGAASTRADSASEGDARAEPEPLSLDHVFEVLKNKRRRRVLRFLEETEGTVSLSETAERIAAQENDKDVSQISSAERKRVYVGLYQCHLPKMDSMGIVSFNKPRGTIDLGDHADEVFEYLEVRDEEPERPRHAYSATLSALGLCVLAVAMAMRPTTALPVVESAVAVILLSFLTYALIGLRSARNVAGDEE